MPEQAVTEGGRVVAAVVESESEQRLGARVRETSFRIEAPAGDYADQESTTTRRALGVAALASGGEVAS